MGRRYAQIHTELVRQGLSDCDPSCLTAAEDRCVCACGGKNHGRDREKLQERIEYLNKLLQGVAVEKDVE